MKLYKILRLTYDKGVSVFPAETQSMPDPADMAGEPITDLVDQIVARGYTRAEGYAAIQGWAYHAKFDLNQGARGVRVFCEMCVGEMKESVPPGQPMMWSYVIAAAIIAAVALGLYLWITLDEDRNVISEGHQYAYLMTYDEYLYTAEILNVGLLQEGVYEQCYHITPTVIDFRRNVWHVPRMDWMYFAYPGVVLRGRRLVFYHIYRIHFLELFYCGLLANFGNGTYKLLSGGQDRYKPRGIWQRPGDRWGIGDYQGCWKEFWWL